MSDFIALCVGLLWCGSGVAAFVMLVRYMSEWSPSVGQRLDTLLMIVPAMVSGPAMLIALSMELKDRKNGVPYYRVKRGR